MIEFGELRIGETARKHLKDVCDSNWASMGPKVKEFETKWNDLFGYTESVAVSSGTDACLNACLALYEMVGAKPGDEIIVPALSFIATSNAVRAAGFTPVFVDVSWDLNINPYLIEEKITAKTKAIMVVHTMGKPCQMDRIMGIANKHNLIVIEDCCEAHGAKYKGTTVGKWGHMSCFSFYIAHLICCGEGGMVSTNRDNIGRILRSTRSHGRKDGDLYFDHVNFGLNSKMNDLEASLGLEGIESFWETYQKRKHNLYYLMNRLKKYEGIIYFNTEDDYENVCPHGLSITFKAKDVANDFYKHLEKCRIKVKRNFGCIPTQHKAFEYLGYKKGAFPFAEYIGDNGVHIGVHQYLSMQDLEYISNVICKYLDTLK